MKILKPSFALLLLLLAVYGADAQCSNQLNTISYDTVVNGSGNATYTFSFPQFNPALGTLTQVDFNSKVTLIYSFQLENDDNITVNNYRSKISRDDEVSGTALQSPLTNSYQKTYGNYSLSASDGIPYSGTDYTAQGPLYVMNQVSTNNTVFNTADFMGNGLVGFDYNTATYSTVLGNTKYSYHGTAQDVVNFKITYTFCPSLVLASDITSFTVNKINNGVININWITQNEKPTCNYELQKSTDGRNYRSVAEFAAKTGASQTGSYSYSYQIQSADNNKTLLFRLKQVNNGTARYSAVHAVKQTASANNQPVLYPNPVKGTANLFLSNTKRSNWEIEVYSLSGQLLKRYTFNNALIGKLNTGNEFQKGVYMLNCINKTSKERYIQRMIVE
jgi:hypothetical protein